MIGCFSRCCNKMLETEATKGRRGVFCYCLGACFLVCLFVLGSQFGAEKVWWQEEVASHMASTVRSRERWMLVLDSLSPFSLFIQPRPPAHGMVPSMFRGGSSQLS